MLKRLLPVLLIITLMAALLPSVFAAKTATNLTSDGAIDIQAQSFMSQQEFEVLSGINKARANAGVDPITVFEKLQTVGDIRSSEIAVKYANERPNGNPYYSALTDAGIKSYKSLSEVYVKNYTTAAAFVAALQRSSGTAATMVNSKFYHCAVGYSYIDSAHYWTLMYYVNHTCAHSGFELILPSNMTFKNGTTIDKMYLLGKTSCRSCGTSYFPIVSEYCTGFDTTVSGKQTVTVNCFGILETFEVNMELEQVDPDLKPEEMEMLLILNRERLTEGLDPVTAFPLLQKVGDIRSTEIAESFSHERPDGQTCYTAIAEANLPGYYTAAENIAGGLSNAVEAMDGFMNSSGHRSNILNANYRHVGLGYHYDSASKYKYHWSQMFYTAHACNYSVMMLEIPENMTFHPDHSIDDMGVLVRLYCDVCGVTFMPLNKELCTGYEPLKSGEQTITVNAFGMSSSFKINILEHEHTFTSKVYTFCDKEGYTEHICSECDYVCQDEFTPALGHDYRRYTSIEPTLTSTGLVGAICSRCNEYQSNTLPMLNDTDYVLTVITAPTCSANGVGEYTYYIDDWSGTYTAGIPALGHDYRTVVTAPTCVDAGYTTYTCATCGSSSVGNETDPTGHSYDAVVTEPTCTESGFTTHTCSVCGDHYTDNKTEPTGHSYKSHITTPTCDEVGFTTYTCSFCDDSYVADEVEATGHAYIYTESGEKHTVTCENCDYTAEEEHSFVDGSCICGAAQNTDPSPDPNLKFNMDIAAGAEMIVNYNFMASIVSEYEDFYLEVRKDVAGGEPIVTTFGITEDHIEMGKVIHPATGAALLYNAAYTGINAKEMGDNFATTLYAIDANGKIYKGETVVSSIKTFLFTKLNDEASIPELKTMAVDMLKYGAAAQVNFSYDVENLVTADLTEEQLALATQEIPEAVDYASITGTGANVNTNITVNSKVELSLSCIAAGQAGVKCIITDSEGKILAELATTNMAGVMYSAVYDNVGASQMREVITATFYNAEGVAISNTVQWSVESYVAQTRARDTATETEIAMVDAMLTYGDSVAAYMTAK